MKLQIIKIFKTPYERMRGLRDISKLEYNEGVLFIMPGECNEEFWNYGVEYPIDVAFFNYNKKLIDVKQLEKQQILPVKSTNGPYKYVIETNKGWFKQYHIKPGTKFTDLIEINLIGGN